MVTQQAQPQLPQEPHQPQQAQQLPSLVTDLVVSIIEPHDLGVTLSAAQEPVNTINAFEALEQCVNEELPVVPSPSRNKKRKNKSPGASSKQMTHSVVIGLRALKETNVISRITSLEGESFTMASGKKSVRLAGLPPASSTTF